MLAVVVVLPTSTTTTRTSMSTSTATASLSRTAGIITVSSIFALYAYSAYASFLVCVVDSSGRERYLYGVLV